MKKNFLMVASLLIAAMLLVVSCAQEVKAPADNNLVEVTLNTSAARSTLNYSGFGDSNNGAITYRYKLTAQWHPESVNGADQVVGNTTDATGAVNGYISLSEGTATANLGYVSQGLWEVDVIGSIGEKDVLKGTTQVYINKNNNTVNVYVKPIETAEKAGIELDIKVNDHDASSQYKLVYSIEKVDGSEATGTVGTESKGLTNLGLDKGQNLDENGFRSWTTKITKMTPGYYRVTVTMMNGTSKVGGLTKGVLLFAEDANAKLSGYVNSSDFINGTLNVYYPTVSVAVTAGDITAGTITIGDNTVNTYDVTYTAIPTIAGNNSITGTTTYTWYADGVKVTSENAESTYTAQYKQTEPGYKTVTCVVKYTFSVEDAGDTIEYVVQGAKDLTTKVDAVTQTSPSQGE
ncbi:MAG: hypothetical protein MR687_06960 [Spirochaetales bacterium]|nr:hypothetical protein [Spirochaetales bacterium]